VQAGQSLTVIKKLESCTEIIERIVDEAKSALNNAQKYI
jgi:NAD(P)H-dependent flavin oxidoreductase YrpB (nitropropane dioxygenase family)